MYFIVGLCRAAQRHERHSESFCSFFAKKEPKKLPTIFHKPYRECGKQTGVFPLAAVGIHPHPTEKGKWDMSRPYGQEPFPS
jgi:hypothetical protein